MSRNLMATNSGIQRLLSLPPRMAEAFQSVTGRTSPAWFAGSDPAQKPLGSGGATAHLLAEAWRQTGAAESFEHWLEATAKLVIHSGGQSRRLPAYAPTGKVLLPVPVFRWAYGQRLDQTLLDLQLPDYERVLAHARGQYAVMVASGDVLLRFGRALSDFPAVDVLGLGMWVPPEIAQDFGVYFLSRAEGRLAFFLQKPPPGQVREFSVKYHCLVDTGVWLLSRRAVQVLMKRCGWQTEAGQFGGGGCVPYELYGQFGLSLGTAPTQADPEISGLTCAVMQLPDAEFHHFGTNRQMLGSTAALHQAGTSASGLAGSRTHPRQVNQNSRLEAPLRREGDQVFWIENSVVPDGWQLASEHVLTGIPDNDWALRLERGVCLDFVPVGEAGFCVRPYGFNDPFSGQIGDPSTTWFGLPVSDWFFARGLAPQDCGLQAEADIQHAPLFPLCEAGKLDGEFVQWLVATAPPQNKAFAARWRQLRRCSAAELCREANLERLFAQRKRLRDLCLPAMMKNHRASVFFHLDLEATAAAAAAQDSALPELRFSEDDDPLSPAHYEMFRSAVLRHRRDPAWRPAQTKAFEFLRGLLQRGAGLPLAAPRRTILEDQIVWARSPVRLDLAGGWTDTPPYCLQHGGAVVNVGVEINGQPPIQVFIRATSTPAIVLRSIDLGMEERVQTYEELDSFGGPENTFGLAKAALALAGFLPRFFSGAAPGTLKAHLGQFGGGLEISLLAAVPKGSGLGTSSILGMTLLAALNDACGLGWNADALFARTLALEQMLTTGGGWQDQAGALYRGAKLVETAPGLAQSPKVRWLPEHLLTAAAGRVLLYYTGLTRLAKNILAEIVRNMFLNSPAHLRTLEAIGANAHSAAEALERCDYQTLAAAVRKSWELNQELDPGTNPPPVQELLDRIAAYSAAAKLLGAGGGGYLLIFAHDLSAAARIREILTTQPPNPRARFVDFCLSDTGLQVTRS